MHPLIEANRSTIADLCRQHGVRKLDVFGSVLDDGFDPERSDVDVVVEFEPTVLGKNFDRYMNFKTALEALFLRPVDLLELHSLRNTRLRQHIEAARVPVYAAA